MYSFFFQLEKFRYSLVLHSSRLESGARAKIDQQATLIGLNRA